MYLVLLYDISLAPDGPQRAKDTRAMRWVFKTCKKYLTHIQKSVFEGELSEPQLAALKIELRKHLRRDRDSCILFRGRNNIWMQKEFLTEPVEQTSQFL